MSSSSFLRQVSKDKEGVSEGGEGGKRGGGKQKKGKGGRRGRDRDEDASPQWEIQFMSNAEVSSYGGGVEGGATLTEWKIFMLFLLCRFLTY